MYISVLLLEKGKEDQTMKRGKFGRLGCREREFSRKYIIAIGFFAAIDDPV